MPTVTCGASRVRPCRIVIVIRVHGVANHASELRDPLRSSDLAGGASDACLLFRSIPTIEGAISSNRASILLLPTSLANSLRRPYPTKGS